MASMGALVTDTPEHVASAESAFDVQFAAARGRLVRVCAGFVGADAADDVVQDAYLRARSRQRQLRDADLFEAWLTRIAINLCMNLHRSQRRWLEKPPILVRRESVAPSRDAGLQELVEQLPSRERAFRSTTPTALYLPTNCPPAAHCKSTQRPGTGACSLRRVSRTKNTDTMETCG